MPTERTYSCDSCGEDVSSTDVVRHEGDYLCEYCYDNRQEEEYQEDESPQNIHEHDHKPTAEFHHDNGRSSQQQVRIGSFPMPYMGIELETESTRNANIDDCAGSVVENCNGLIYIKADGSITHGFEMVSHPMTLGYAQNHLDGFWSSLAFLRKAGFRAWQTSTCGLHIHISRNAFLSDVHQQKFLYFIYGDAKESIKLFAGRDSHWSKFDKDAFCDEYGSGGSDDYKLPSLMDVVKGYRKDGSSVAPRSAERYLAVNRNNRHTLELRFFRPSLRPDTVLACIEFTHCVWAYTEQVTANQALKHNALSSFEMFAKYARANRTLYPKLVAHLAYRNVSPDPDAPQGALSGEE